MKLKTFINPGDLYEQTFHDTLICLQGPCTIVKPYSHVSEVSSCIATASSAFDFGATRARRPRGLVSGRSVCDVDWLTDLCGRSALAPQIYRAMVHYETIEHPQGLAIVLGRRELGRQADAPPIASSLDTHCCLSYKTVALKCGPDHEKLASSTAPDLCDCHCYRNEVYTEHCNHRPRRSWQNYARGCFAPSVWHP